MSSQLDLKGFHHLTLTVSDYQRAREFYTSILGLDVVAEISPTRCVVGNSQLFFGISEPPDPDQALDSDRFNENRVGLDHLCFTVNSRQDIERAQQFFAEMGVRHAEIKDLPSFGITVMMFWDPDNIQLELAAPMN